MRHVVCALIVLAATASSASANMRAPKEDLKAPSFALGGPAEGLTVVGEQLRGARPRVVDDGYPDHQRGSSRNSAAFSLCSGSGSKSYLRFAAARKASSSAGSSVRVAFIS